MLFMNPESLLFLAKGISRRYHIVVSRDLTRCCIRSPDHENDREFVGQRMEMAVLSRDRLAQDIVGR